MAAGNGRLVQEMGLGCGEEFRTLNIQMAAEAKGIMREPHWELWVPRVPRVSGQGTGAGMGQA